MNNLYKYSIPLISIGLLVLYSSMTNAQTCHSGILTTPDIDFTVNNDGTVTHEITGLMWKSCSEGQTWDNTDDSCATGVATTHTWENALQIPQSLNSGGGFAGHSDWRLPNLKELKSIVEFKCSEPSINAVIFKNSMADGGYWSSSPSSFYTSDTWAVLFERGYDVKYSRSESHYVRLVRSEQ